MLTLAPRAKRDIYALHKVVLQKSEEGYGVACPVLPGCWSQGDTEDEALENIKDAIQEYKFVLEDKSHE